MEIKICGIRRDEDIDIINKYKPDYIGFIFAESKRQITVIQAARLSKKLSEGIKTVGVFVNADAKEVEETAITAGLYAVQLHGDEDEKYIKNLNVPCQVWKVVRVREGETIDDVAGADRILLDKYTENVYGGSGTTFDWSKAGSINTDKPIILAGGLTSANVREGIRIFNPACVDVSSSVETDGAKDERKVKEFIDVVRNVENEQNRREI